jgi:hypothetical protein
VPTPMLGAKNRVSVPLLVQRYASALTKVKRLPR